MIHRNEVARVYAPLLDPARYKGAYGGRGGAKSHQFGGQLVEDSLAYKGLLSVCIREVQQSLKESAKRLLEAKVRRYPANCGFKIYSDRIATPGDGIIIFNGMNDHNADSIKSLEGFNRAWIEEAHSLSARSLMLLRPTIRAKGSEIWASWNPTRKTDAIDLLLRGPEPPKDSIVVRANWRDNPWFTEVLNEERLHDLKAFPERYPHVWEGEYASAFEGAYYARQLTEAKTQGRICVIARDPLMSIYAVFDIGGTGAKADATAIWIVQIIGRQVMVLDHYEAVGQPLAEHVAWLRGQGYGGAEIILPHDGGSHDKVHQTSYEKALREAGFSVTVRPNQGRGAASKRIEAVRRLFPQIWFNSDTTEPGREALGWYHEKKDEARGIGLGPKHDWASHSADAFGEMAIFASEKMDSGGTASDWSKPIRNRRG